ncbi:MAG TPA: cysteine-rich CWC family protein [Pseudobacter sp.]|jgi:hypothetical protein|nr:cysteine-rich CWC family protein [Pseudobacter sp.]
MCKHEAKKCPRCNAGFECKVGDVTHCQCYGISLDYEQRAFLEARYGECLCRACLLELSQKDTFFKEKHAWHDHR